MPEQKEVKEVIEEAGRGLNHGQIAEKFGVSRQQVFGQIQRLMFSDEVRRRPEGNRYGGIWRYYTKSNVTVEEWREMGEKKSKEDWE